MFYFVPLESLPERYTEQMYGWVVDDLTRRGIPYRVVTSGVRPVESPSGAFLDFTGRTQHALGQMQAIARFVQDGEICDGDTFFFADVFHPGLTSLRYMLDGRCYVYVYAIDYAGPFDPDDALANSAAWCKVQELAYLLACDKVFLGSHYHRRLLTNGIEEMLGPDALNALGAETWLCVTGLVYEPDMVGMACDCPQPKRPYVIWPHRWCEEKGNAELAVLARGMPRVTFVITTGRKGEQRPEGLTENVLWMNVSKGEYYGLLRNASLMLSTAHQETFGYTVREAEVLGTPVLCPTRACYPEFLQAPNLYADYQHAQSMIEAHVADTKRIPLHVTKRTAGFAGMLDEMVLRV